MSAQRRPRIERRKVPLDPAEVAEMEAALVSAIRAIQIDKATPDFVDLFEKAHTLLLHREAHRMYNTFKDGMKAHLEEVQAEVANTGHSHLLETLFTAWQEHHTAVKKMKNILIYPEPVYVHGGHAVDVYGLGLLLFRDQVVHHPPVGQTLRETMLNMVNRERNGERSERETMKNMCQMLLELSLENNEVYQEDFERPLLKVSRQFYRAESKRLLQENSASDYLKRVEWRIQEESKLAELYLHPTTKKKLTKIVDDELIKYHMDAIVKMDKSGLVHMLDDDLLEDLGRMYKLYTRVDGGLLCLMKCMSAHLRETGRDIVLEDGETPSSNAVVTIQSLLDLRDKYDQFLAGPFNKDQQFTDTIDQDFEIFVNLTDRSPEYLSLFIDDLFKKGAKGKTEQEVDITLDKCIVLLRFLHERDTFKAYYEKHLHKRLLSSKGYSDDLEKSMISKFKAECGSVFTRNMEGMLKDITLSTTTMENYRKKVEAEKGSIELSVRVLTMSHWPFRSSVVPTVVPTAAESAFIAFRTFYLEEYSGRSLTLQPQLGNADLNATFYPPNAAKKKHILQVSTHQMCVLMMFNRKPSFTMKDLQEETQIPQDQLVRVLQTMTLRRAQYRVLSWDTKSEQTNFGPDDRFSVNEQYTSKLVRVNLLPQAVKKETDPERKETRQKVDDGRKYEIQATVVRVMKARKKLQHQELIAECLDQLKSRFRPDPVAIKKEIESLIERDYLRRTAQHKNVYEYLA